ncbi:DUF5667 domain-containing protein [Blastococcus atacamensis]|uniref:DUF5667 domain-containing protein n=1 Tax=Blastococcus atacamensis TaxID=2070508 RepID=UPI0012FFEC5A|nr:DUF5667 domain-containing protein [Blastococcus atacamensis]
MGVTGLAALVAVAAGAQPGDPLYDLKRGTEQTQLALAGESRGQTLLELASTRLDELRTVTGDAELVEQTLRTMDRQTTEGAAILTARAVATADADTLEDLAAWTDRQSSGLEALRAEMPGPAEPAFAGSVDLLQALDTRTAGLSTILGCASGPVTVGEDALGPVPGLCVTETPAPAPEEVPALPPVATGPSTTPVIPSAPAVPSPTGNGSPAAVPTPGTTPVPPADTLPTAGAVPPAPNLPLPGVPSDSATRTTTTPPAVAVPLPGPIRICLPPLATVGNC